MNDFETDEKTKAEPYVKVDEVARAYWDRMDRAHAHMTDDDAYDDYRERTR